jgi:hypothetical protein
MSKRKGAWSFSAVWTFPGHETVTVAATSIHPTLLKNEILHMKAEMKRLVLGAQRFPYYLRIILMK